ncbi:unnamed protein product, partial [Effrenium voratum]
MRVFSGGVHEESPIHIEVQAEQPTAGRPSGEFESHGQLEARMPGLRQQAEDLREE